MNIQSIQTIGEAIYEKEYDTTLTHAKYTTPWILDDADLTRECRIVVRMQHTDRLERRNISERLEFDRIEWQEIPDIFDAATRHVYAHRAQHIDYSLSRRVTNGAYQQEFQRMREWLQDMPAERRAGTVLEDLNEFFARRPTALLKALTNAEQSEDERALMTVVFRDSAGNEIFAKDIDAVCDETVARAVSGFEQGSAARSASGPGKCCVCGIDDQVYGLEANNIGAGRFLPFKRQGFFPYYNASHAWLSRPLCEQCLLDVRVGLNFFLDKQTFGIPNIRCRYLPYALPGNQSLLRSFVWAYRASMSNESSMKRAEYLQSGREAFLKALEWYRANVDNGHFRDGLRFEILFYRQEKAKIHGVESLTGVKYQTIYALYEACKLIAASTSLRSHPSIAGNQADEPNTSVAICPSIDQLLSGFWFYLLFSFHQSSVDEGANYPETDSWKALTESVFSRQSIDYQTSISEAVNEMIAAETEHAEYSHCSARFIRTHLFLRACDTCGYLTGIDEGVPPLRGIDSTYQSYNTAIQSVFEHNPMLTIRPERAIAVSVGMMAVWVSEIETTNAHEPTFLDSHELAALSTATMKDWLDELWERVTFYERTTTPVTAALDIEAWRTLFSIANQQYFKMKQEAADLSDDEVRYFYVTGINIANTLTVESERNTMTKQHHAKPHRAGR